jgi:hypothetical protein
MPILREFTQQHPLAQHLSIDWNEEVEKLPATVIKAVSGFEDSLLDTQLVREDKEKAELDLHHWHDDLRRAHLMSNDLSVQEFRSACNGDRAFDETAANYDPKELSLWMLTHRDQAFRNAEMHIAFQAKSNGKYWKKHRIQAELDLEQDRSKLEAFCSSVAKLYKNAGGGDNSHVEVSKRAADGSVQLTIYIEGPITAIAHFADSRFLRINTRIALETALVYQPSTGFIETVVKGGAKNHTAVLELFGKHVVEQEIKPEEIERTKYKLNALRDGMLEPFDDWSRYGVEQIRLRRAKFFPTGQTGTLLQVEASPAKDQQDAIQLALERLKIHHSFESEYNMIGASIIVYKLASEDEKMKHFSFDLSSNGSSTIKNLPEKNQAVALAVLRSLNVIESEEIAA